MPQQPLDPEDALAAEQLFGPAEDDTPAQEAPEEPTPEPEAAPDPNAELLERLKKLESRVGTDDDVSVVKSQRDKIKNENEQIRPAIEALQQQIAALAAQRAQDDDQAFDYQWQQWIAGQTDKQAAQARYEVAQQNRLLQRRAAAVAQAEQGIRQAQEQQYFGQVIENTKRIFRDLAMKAGVPPSELDETSEDALKASFEAAYQKKQRQEQTPARVPGHKPQRGGAPAPAKDVRSWFSQKAATNKWGDIEQAFQAAENIRGLDINEILRR